jgi:hypothetical protein
MVAHINSSARTGTNRLEFTGDLRGAGFGALI